MADSEVEAYVAATDRLEVLAQTRGGEGIDARANAELIVRAVNAYEQCRLLITELIGALELCLGTGKLAPSVLHEAVLI